MTDAELEALDAAWAAGVAAQSKPAKKPTKKEVKKEASWLRSYARKKPINNYGGNYWGFNRSRCSIIRPEMIQALVEHGYATMQGHGSFVMVPA